MKMFYITINSAWSDIPYILCQEFSAEGVGYDGYTLENTFELKSKEEIEKHGFFNSGITFIRQDEVAMVKEFMACNSFNDPKNVYVSGNSPDKWRRAFEFHDNKESIQFHEVEFKF